MKVPGKWKRSIPVIVYSLAIVIESAQSKAPVPDLGFEMQDKLYHLAGYTLYGLLLTYALRATSWHWKRVVMFTLLIGALFAASDEWHQYFVPGRSCDIFDWIADVCGLTVSCALSTLYNKRSTAHE